MHSLYLNGCIKLLFPGAKNVDESAADWKEEQEQSRKDTRDMNFVTLCIVCTEWLSLF